MGLPQTVLTPSDTAPQDLERMLAAAAAAAPLMNAMLPEQRGGYLRAVADALEAHSVALVGIAAEETYLAQQRLNGELVRATTQLRMFAEAVEEGSYLEVAVDRASGPDALTPRPEVRRMLVPLGPVLVFAASNFPFAFSVAGGDTASALATGCPVLVKAHPGHPRLSLMTHRVMDAALREAGAPDGALSVLFGQENGVTALLDERVTAAAFTGSTAGGRTLLDLASRRAVPIPFYGELGSLNPVVVTPRASERRGTAIVEQFVDSMTTGAGQFCTKPGLLLLPKGHELSDALRYSVSRVSVPMRLLTDRIHEQLVTGLSDLLAIPGVTLAAGTAPDTDGEDEGTVRAAVLEVGAADLVGHQDVLLRECFGPVSLVATYRDTDDLLHLLELLDGTLAASVHGEPEDIDLVRPVLTLLERRAGRVLWNGWPTGVAVGWATHHGGPYPATTGSIHTSVGVTAMRRFLRPVAYQSMPDALLPEPLREENPLGVPRRVNGVLIGAPDADREL